MSSSALVQWSAPGPRIAPMSRASRGARAPKSVSTVSELGRREQNKLEKRERLRVAAEALFHRRGYEVTTTREVAEAAGVATGTLFLYARDKQDLLFLVMHDKLQRASDEAFVSLPKRASFPRACQHVFGHLFRLYTANDALGRVFVRVLPGATGPNAELVNALTFAFLQRLAVMVQESQARGELRAEVEPMLAATTLFSLYFSALTAWLSGFVDADGLDDHFARLLELLVHGLAR